MSSIVRDLGSPDLWQRSLERSLRRRELAEAARREIGRRRRASVAATAAVAVAPVATSVSFSSSTAAAAKAAAQPNPHTDADRVLLEFGSTGSSVRQVQRALGLVVDGIYGPRTEHAVVYFQRSSGLPATGKVDVRTWVALLRHMQSWRATPPSSSPAIPERDVAPEPVLNRAPAPAASSKPATKRAPAHKTRAKAVKPAAAEPRRQVKRQAPSKPPSRDVRAKRPAASKAPAVRGSVGRILESIASCESGGNPRAVGGGGTYRGLYQFDQQTWESLGGTGDPAAASPADQTKRAAMLYAQRGASAWPTCGPSAMHAASASRGEAPGSAPSQEQEQVQVQVQQPADRAEAPRELTAAAAQRHPATSAAAAPQPQERAAGADTAPEAGAESSQTPRATPAPDDPAPSAQERDASTQSDSLAPSQSAPTAPRDGQSNESAGAPEGPRSVPAPQVPAAGEPLQDLSPVGSDQPSPAQEVEVPEPSQAVQPDPGATLESSAPVADGTDPSGEVGQGLADGPPAPTAPATAVADAAQVTVDRTQSP